jgi:hypothetical protein
VSEESWRQARLIPTSGIDGADEQERRALSALLAVMTAVREFGRALTTPLGAPPGPIEAYIEVPFELGGGRHVLDGLIRVRRSQRTWTALVEVKTGPNTLLRGQVETYLELASRQGFDAVLTISNEIPPVPGQHPVIDRRKLNKKVSLHHLSWLQVLAAAVRQKVHRGIADPDQAWILGELIRYLEHPRAGALEFTDMGPSWEQARKAVVAGTLRPADRLAAEVSGYFDELLRYVSLRLGRQLGTDVTSALSRKDLASRTDLADPTLRTRTLAASLAASLAGSGVLEGAVRIPDAVAPIVVTADIRASRITCHVEIDAPREGTPTTRVDWLVQQLHHAPDAVRVEALAAPHTGPGPAELLRDLRDKPGLLTTDPARELPTFRVAMTTPMGVERGRGPGSFIDSLLGAVDDFYSEVVQNIKVWTAMPPKFRETPEPPPPVSLASTALSSQDGPQRAAARTPARRSDTAPGRTRPPANPPGTADEPESRER